MLWCGGSKGGVDRVGTDHLEAGEGRPGRTTCTPAHTRVCTPQCVRVCALCVAPAVAPSHRSVAVFFRRRAVAPAPPPLAMVRVPRPRTRRDSSFCSRVAAPRGRPAAPCSLPTVRRQVRAGGHGDSAHLSFPANVQVPPFSLHTLVFCRTHRLGWARRRH